MNKRNIDTCNKLNRKKNRSAQKFFLPFFCEQVKAYLVWPTVAEWRAMRETWAKLPSAVGAIDGTFHRIYRPEVEPQELYYSGHRHFHCMHTQVVVDVHGTICYIESGYQGHLMHSSMP